MDQPQQETRTPETAQPAAAPGAPTPLPAAPEGMKPIPEDALILITTRNLVLYPGIVLPMTMGRQRSVIAAQTAIRLSRPVGIVLQRDPALDDPLPADLHRVGTEANLLRYVTSPDGNHHVICQGERRFRIEEFLDGYPFFVARVERMQEAEEASTEIEARLLNLRNQAMEVLPTPAADAGGTGQRRAGRHLGAGPGRSDRQLHGPHAEREAGNPRNLLDRAAP